MFFVSLWNAPNVSAQGRLVNDGDVVWSDANGRLLDDSEAPCEVCIPYDVLAQCDTDADEADRLRAEVAPLYARLERSEARNRELESRPGFFAGVGVGTAITAVLIVIAVLASD